MTSSSNIPEQLLWFSHFSIERAPDAVFWIDSEARISRVNEAACRQLGYALDELTGMTVPEIDPNFDKEKWRELRDVIAREKVMSFETFHRARDGQLIPVEVTSNYFEFEGEAYTCSFARDISERRRSEEALRESEKRSRTLYENTPVMMHSVDSEIRIVSVNNHWLETLGYAKEEVIGHRATDFLTEQSRAFALKIAIPRLRQERALNKVAYELVKKNGDIIDVELTSVAEVNAEGELVRSLAFLLDVTDQKKTQAALHNRIEFERVISDISTYFINISWEQIDRAVAYALQRMGDFVGADRSYVFILREDHAYATNTHEWCAQGVVPQMDNLQNLPMSEIPWVAGKLRNLESIFVASMDELPREAALEREHWRQQDIQSLLTVPLTYEGELIGFLGFDAVRAAKEWVEEDMRLLHVAGEIIATSLRRRATEQALRESEVRLTNIFESAMDAIVTVDARARIVFMNGAAETVFDCQAEEVLGSPLAEFLVEESRSWFEDYMRSKPSSQKSSDVYVWMPEGLNAVRRNGAPFPIEATFSRAEFGGGTYVTIILRDIDQRMQARAELSRLQSQNLYLQEELEHELNFGEIIGTSPVMREVFKSIEMVAATDATVLLLGETGTGKELIARAIHNSSPRRERVMIKVNCGALPAGLVESELFGHEKGAFTGATAQKKGKFEMADRGSLFLDEVGELPNDAQVKLLRVLQEQEIERVGGQETLKVDVRVIAATNRNLEQHVRNGKFRADLFYRLNIFPIQVPPLRERREDIPLLASYFVRKFAHRVGKQVDRIDPAAMGRLQRFDWQGNVRELANILERAVILCQDRGLREKHIIGLNPAAVSEQFPSLEEMERRHIIEALKKTGGVLAGPRGAASLLGINRSTLWSRMRKLGIEFDRQAVRDAK